MSELLDIIKSKIESAFKDALVSSTLEYDYPVLVLDKNQTYNVLQFLKEDADLNFHFLTTLCAIHQPDEIEDKEFGVMYQLHNMFKNYRIRIKTFMPKSDLNIQSVTSLWKTANWMERQEYDFFGINFVGHPKLTRILNMDEMNYFPMRKEYPLEDLGRTDKDDKMFGR